MPAMPVSRPGSKIPPTLRRLALIAALLPSLARADLITPATYSASLDIGDSTSFVRTVTIDRTLNTGLVDIFFLADSTGSMGTAIESVQLGAASLMNATAGLGDVRWGVGEYRDVVTGSSGFVYRTNQDLTAEQDAVQDGIDNWITGFGGDIAEAGLYALKQVANTVSWRPGSTRILAWFGDAPGHDPRNGSTEASATAALQAAGIKVEAIDVGTQGTATSLDALGQASRIAAATGGHFYKNVADETVATAIEKAIGFAVSNYTKVCLDTDDTPGGILASVSSCITGQFDRKQTRSFEFEVSYAGNSAGSYGLNSYASVDGGRVASAFDRITVNGGTPAGSVPLPGTFSLLFAGLLALLASQRFAAGRRPLCRRARI